MTMFCPDCQQNLDDVPLDDPCPQCGGMRRSAQVSAGAALVAAAAMDVGVKIGYSLDPGWTYQWRSIQHHLARLREQYQGIEVRGNLDVEETVHSLFLALDHLSDWLYQDRALSLTKGTVTAFVNQHPKSLALCRAYSNTRKHVRRKYPGELIALITSIESSRTGQTATIGYRPWDDPTVPLTEVDALTLAEQCEQDWRDFLTRHHIPIPS